MSIDVESLLAPVSEDAPSGVDVGLDPAFFEFETLFKGEEERQVGEEIVAAQDPEWPQVVKQATALLEKGRHLRVLVQLTVGLMKTRGAEGLRDGLTLLTESLKRHWDTLYPELDEDGDAIERVNIVSALSASVAAMGDTIRFRRRLQQVQLIEARGMGVVTPKEAHAAAQGDADVSQMVMAVSLECDLDGLKATAEAFDACAALAKELDEELQRRVGAAEAANLDDLHKDLAEICRMLSGWLEARGVGDGAGEGEGEDEEGDGGGGGGAPAPAAPGTITSNADVDKMLTRIREYYTKKEPSSPVPMVLEVAQSLVGKSFKDIASALPPERVEVVNRILESASGGDSA